MSVAIGKPAKDGEFTVTVKPDVKGTPSSSGKTLVLASTHGNQKFQGPDGEDWFIGVNVYKRKGN